MQKRGSMELAKEIENELEQTKKKTSAKKNFNSTASTNGMQSYSSQAAQNKNSKN
jgi:hypothetical protein